MSQYDELVAERQECLWSFFRARTREGLKTLLEAFMEHERDVFLACEPFQRSERRRGYRNGFQIRWLDTPLGPVRLRKPRVRDAEGTFQSQVIARYQRRAPRIERAVREWIACGASTRDVVRLARTCFRIEFSAGAVSTIVARLDRTIARFHTRP